jgi:hypothetical protein
LQNCMVKKIRIAAIVRISFKRISFSETPGAKILGNSRMSHDLLMKTASSSEWTACCQPFRSQKQANWSFIDLGMSETHVRQRFGRNRVTFHEEKGFGEEMPLEKWQDHSVRLTGGRKWFVVDDLARLASKAFDCSRDKNQKNIYIRKIPAWICEKNPDHESGIAKTSNVDHIMMRNVRMISFETERRWQS